MPVTRERLHRTLNPEVVAVIGDKQASGYNWLRSLQTFTGKLYSVQVDPNEIPGIEAMGIENYASLTDIPERVDFAVCAVPRNVAAVHRAVVRRRRRGRRDAVHQRL